MRLAAGFAVLLASLAPAADRTPAPLTPAQAAQRFQLPDGFRATVFAAEPDVVQPVSFAIDDRGRLWVAEAFNYGTWQATGKDRITILEDADGDGRAEKRTMFHEGFNYITGIEVGFGGVWVMSPPGLYFIPDRNGDDKPDGEPELLFDGFGYKESRHNLANGFTWGPDGWLYAGHGRTSPSDVGRPGTPRDKRIHCDGGVVRVHPTKLTFEVFADGTTNPWGVSFDEYGQCFVSNCVNPHLFHMIPGGHYEPWRNRPSSLYAYERLPTIADHLHYPTGKPKEMRGETPEVLAMGGGHAHCGTLVYLGDSFPEKYRGSVLMCNVHGRRINNDLLQRKGSGYTASHGKDFAVSADPWFMGVTLKTGPDGSVFVSDWSDTGECHTYKPETATGRIYKLQFGDAKAKPVDVAAATDDQLVKWQAHPNEWFASHARRVLQERAAKPGWDGTAVHAALWKIVGDRSNTARRLRGLWALRVTGGLTTDALSDLLADESASVPAWAVRLLCDDGTPAANILDRLARLAKANRPPEVRLALASALQRLPVEHRWDIAAGLVAHPEDAADANLPLMVWYGVEPLVPADPDRALALAAAGDIPLVRQFAARRTIDAATVKGSTTNLDPLVAVLAKASPAAQRDLLAGAREALRGRRGLAIPAGWPAVYPALAKNPDTRESAVALALAFGDPTAIADLRTLAADPTAAAADRAAALQSLVEGRAPDLAPVLHALLADAATRRVALRGLAAYPHADTATKLLAAYPSLTPDEKLDAVATLAARKDSALALLAALEKQAIPRADVTAFAARQMFSLSDAAVSDRLKAVWGEVRETAADKKPLLAKYKAQLTPAALKAADLDAGRALFAKTCVACHKLHGEGGTVGPDLTGSDRSNLDYLLGNLIDPSAEVGRDYRMSVVKLLDGRVLTGIVVEKLPTRLVVQTATEKLVVSPDDVDEVKDSPLSVMPEKQLDVLSREQVRDLIGFLMAKAPPPKK